MSKHSKKQPTGKSGRLLCFGEVLLSGIGLLGEGGLFARCIVLVQQTLGDGLIDLLGGGAQRLLLVLAGGDCRVGLLDLRFQDLMLGMVTPPLVRINR